MNSIALLCTLFVFTILNGNAYPQAAFAGCGSACDGDNDGYSPDQGDCNDFDAMVYPGNGCPLPGIEDIAEVIDDVEELIDNGDFDINSSQTTSLLTKLHSAMTYIEDDKINLAINNLNTFINNINAYINSNRISSEDGNQLIDEVQAIIDSIQ